MKDLGDARAEQINVADERRGVQAVQVHPNVQLGDFARVKADLVDDEVRAALDFFLELQVLRNDFAFAELEVGSDGADAEFGLAKALAAGVRFAGTAAGTEAAIHAPKQRDEADGVDIENGLGETFRSGDRIIAGHGEDVVEA